MESKTKNRYNEDFKKSIVSLYNDGKSQSVLIREYGISQSDISKWIKQYYQVKTINRDILIYSIVIKDLILL